MVRLVWSRIVRLPAEGSFRRLLMLLYSSIVQAGSTANLGILEEFWRNHRGPTPGLGFLLYRIGSVPHRFL
jgi:hypothetical protein